MINRRTFLKLAATVSSAIAGLIPWPAVRTKVATASLCLIDNLGLRTALDPLEPLERIRQVILAHPTARSVDFTRYTHFCYDSLDIRANCWSDEYQQRFHAFLEVEESALNYSYYMDWVCKTLYNSITEALIEGPPKYDYGRSPLIADGEVVWNKS